MKDRANYFDGNNYEDFKKQLIHNYNNPRKVASDHAEYVREQFNDKRMVAHMLERVAKAI